MQLSKYVGIPWNPVGRNEDVGLDCWGLVRLFYENEMGISLPAYSNISLEESGKDIVANQVSSSDLHQQFEKIEDSGIEMGDILVFNIGGMPTHVAIAIGGGRMLHAHKKAGGVVVENFKNISWEKRLEGVYRWKLS